MPGAVWLDPAVTLEERVAHLEKQMAALLEMLDAEDEGEAEPRTSLDGDAIGGERDGSQGLD